MPTGCPKKYSHPTFFDFRGKQSQALKSPTEDFLSSTCKGMEEEQQATISPLLFPLEKRRIEGRITVKGEKERTVDGGIEGGGNRKTVSKFPPLLPQPNFPLLL